jgi:hypothetical protein
MTNTGYEGCITVLIFNIKSFVLKTLSSQQANTQGRIEMDKITVGMITKLIK